MRISFVQKDLVWGDKKTNFAEFSALLDTISQTDIIVLPEMFSTGFHMQPARLAEPMYGETLVWMRIQAKRLGAVITGSAIIEEDGRYYNRLFWVRPDGSFETYNKRHLFRMADEHLAYTGGTTRLITEWRGWRICPMVCYDLRFPVWSRNVNMEYDLLIYVANWPEVRRMAWRTLLQARAIENLSYVVGVNRIGLDGNKMPHAGDSSIIDFKGEVLSHTAYAPSVQTITLSKTDLKSYRQNFPAQLDADAFRIHP